MPNAECKYRKSSNLTFLTVRRDAKNKSPFFLRIGLSSNLKLLPKFDPPPEFAPLYQKNNELTTNDYFVQGSLHSRSATLEARGKENLNRTHLCRKA